MVKTFCRVCKWIIPQDYRAFSRILSWATYHQVIACLPKRAIMSWARILSSSRLTCMALHTLVLECRRQESIPQWGILHIRGKSRISKTKPLGHLHQCSFQLKLWLIHRLLNMWLIRWTVVASSLSMLSLKMAPMPSMWLARSKASPKGRLGNSSFSMMEQTSASSFLTLMEATCLCTMMT